MCRPILTAPRSKPPPSRWFRPGRVISPDVRPPALDPARALPPEGWPSAETVEKLIPPSRARRPLPPNPRRPRPNPRAHARAGSSSAIRARAGLARSVCRSLELRARPPRGGPGNQCGTSHPRPGQAGHRVEPLRPAGAAASGRHLLASASRCPRARSCCRCWPWIHASGLGRLIP
jgi:hypothetical protein